MDVSHGMTSHADATSIAAVVSSREWPKVSKYREEMRIQSRKTEMIESLYKCNNSSEDEGMIKNSLVEFYKSSDAVKPQRMIIYRMLLAVAPINYAHLAVAQMQQFLKADDKSSDSGSLRHGLTSDRLTMGHSKLHRSVATSMFFC